MKLNLGGGRTWRQSEWQNLEKQKGYDLNEKLLTEYKSNSIELIYSSHSLEHLPWEITPKILKDCYRVLEPKGTMRIVVPDMDIIALLLSTNNKQHIIDGNPHYYNWDKKRKEVPLIEDVKILIGCNENGFFRDSGEGTHKSFFTYSILFILLTIAGFSVKNINRMDFCQSSILEMEEEATLNPIGHPDKGFDNTMTKNISLYLEAQK